MRSVFFAVVAATAATAFFIPPTASDSSPISVVPFEFDADSTSRSLQLACPDCPGVLFSDSEPESEIELDSAVPSSLQLTLSVDRSSSNLGHDRLLFNGFEVFPQSDWPGPLHALDHHDPPITRSLGYVLTVRPAGVSDHDLLELLEISLHVVEVDAVPVREVPAVVAMVIKDPAGRLMIATLDAVEDGDNNEYSPPPLVSIITPSPEPETIKCSSIMCYIRRIIANAKSKIRHHCSYRHHRRPGPKLQSDTAKDEDKNEHGHHHSGKHSRPGNPGKPGEHSHGRHHHRRPCSVGSLFRSIVTQIIIPVLIGIGTGVGLSILGMLIASAGVFLWKVLSRRHCRRCVRSSRCCSAKNKSSKASVILDEKAALMAHQEDSSSEPPPSYRDDSEATQ